MNDEIGILGVRGRLGKALIQAGCTGIDIDITNEEQIRNAKLNDCPVIINCAAKTQVDKCQKIGEKHTDYYNEAMKVNMHSLEYLRTSYHGRFIHISTDYVFNCKHGPYDEYAHRDPVNDYGFTKWGGEVLLETLHIPDTIIVRTTGLFGSDNDFASFVLDCLRKGEEIGASNELRGNHTYIPRLAEQLIYLATMKPFPRKLFLHLASSDVMSRYDFALMLAKEFHVQSDTLCSIKTKDIVKWVAPRPTRGGLKVSRAKSLGIPIYSTQEGIQEYYMNTEMNATTVDM